MGSAHRGGTHRDRSIEWLCMLRVAIDRSIDRSIERVAAGRARHTSRSSSPPASVQAHHILIHGTTTHTTHLDDGGRSEDKEGAEAARDGRGEAHGRGRPVARVRSHSIRVRRAHSLNPHASAVEAYPGLPAGSCPARMLESGELATRRGACW